MSRIRDAISKTPVRLAKHRNTVTKARLSKHVVAASKRARGAPRDEIQPYAPPEDWHAGTGGDRSYRIVVQPPGPGYRHVVTATDIRHRLSGLPTELLQPLEVIQLSRMTRKKQTFPCYGMQWGNSLYLYPLEESLVEYFHSPPRPGLVNEVRMYGGRWVQEAPSTWKLIWTPAAIKDFYLNNILFHELGHLLDDRNTNTTQREQYAEWFAIRFGYLPSRRRTATRSRGRRRRVRRRHAS
jgi:hypothetical protein